MGKNRKNKSIDEKLCAGKSMNISKIEPPDTLLGAINPSYFDGTIGKAISDNSGAILLGDMKEKEEMDLFFVGKDQAWILMHFDAQVEIYRSMEHDLDEEERFRWAKNLHFVPGTYFEGDT